jgi:hypothetical protein
MEEGHLRNYPNPFNDSFTLELTGDDTADYEISIVDLVNKALEVRSKLKYNESYMLGGELPQGLYVLKIKEGDKISSMKIIKR